MYKKFFKRLIDIVGSIFGLLSLAPIMLITAIAIKIDSKGPAIFKTKRVGKNCKPFTFYKFRSMRIDAPKDIAPRLLKSEDYITKVGKFIRRTSIDELPQLICILKGDMSIVGPRPSGLSEEDLITARNKYNANSVLPGLTGLAQINGRDILATNVEEKAKVDGEYVKNISFMGDMKIIFSTAKQVLFGKDIVEGAESIKIKEEQDKLNSIVILNDLESKVDKQTIISDNTENVVKLISENSDIDNEEQASA